MSISTSLDLQSARAPLINWGAPGKFLGSSWGTLLVSSWEAPGELLGRSRKLMGSPRKPHEKLMSSLCGARVELLGNSREGPGPYREAPRKLLGSSWKDPGSSWEATGEHLGALGEAPGNSWEGPGPKSAEHGPTSPRNSPESGPISSRHLPENGPESLVR